ncbi:MAG: hypothetical protein ABIQ01_09255 [Pseudolysinimonas sp.]
MGTLFYGSARVSIRVDDAMLAHLRALITTKQRRNEGFLVSWIDSQEEGDGRSSVWIHPFADLHYKFDNHALPQLDSELLEEMSKKSSTSRGVELDGATLLLDPMA